MQVSHMETQKASRSALAFIFVVCLLDILGLSLLIPVTPYIVRQFDSTALMVALLTVVYSIAQFFAAPLLGRLSDRFGRRPVLLVCILGSSIGYLIFGIGGALWVLFLSRVIDGITGGNISVASAYIADITPPQDRAKNFAIIGAAFGLGFVLGPALSGILLPFGYAASAYAAGALSLLSAIVGFFILPESLAPANRNHEPLKLSDANPLGATLELWRRPVLGGLLTAGLVFNFAFAAYVSNIVVFLIGRFNLDAGAMAAGLVASGIVRVLMFPFVGKLVARFGEKTLGVAGLLLQAATLVSIAFVPQVWMIYPLIVLNGIGGGFVFSTLGAMASNQLPLNEQGKLAGVNTALSGVGNIVGPLWAGIAYDSIAPVAPYVSGALLLVVAALMVMQAQVKRVQHAAQSAAFGE
jgi:MFS family permease